MRFAPTSLPGLEIVDLDRMEDDRGWFARTWCSREFAGRGLDAEIAQINVSWNRRAGTLRGMHFQLPPSEEGKVVRCVRGRIYDVVVDLRRDSPAYRRWCALELDASAGRALFIPRGCAHGFQSLEDDTEVLYLMSRPFDPATATGVRYDDPALGIEWPLPVTEMSDKDRNWPLLDA